MLWSFVKVKSNKKITQTMPFDTPKKSANLSANPTFEYITIEPEQKV